MSEISLDQIIEEARAKFGDESVTRLTDKKEKSYPVQRTGIPQLDLALGIGGLPKGRIIEIYGPESSGKTTLALSVIAQAQKDGAWAWYGDMEHALDPQWAETLGVNLDKLLISQPDNGEQCMEMAMYFMKTGVIDIIVVDSVASLVTKAELAGEAGDAHIGQQARLMSTELKKMSPTISRMKCICIFINQIREKIGVMFGSPETTPGGRALKFYSSVRMDVRRIGSIGAKGNEIGNKLKITIKKNKLAPPFKICETQLIFETGFDIGYNLLDAGIAIGIIEKSGKTYSCNGFFKAVGKDNAANEIKSLDKEKLNELYNKICGEIRINKEEGNLSFKDKMAKYQKKLLEASEEEKAKWQRKIDKLNTKVEEIKEDEVDKIVAQEDD
jgi:recombination protein RecA